MKRFFCLLLVLLLLPLVSLADPDRSPVGRWTTSCRYSSMCNNFLISQTDFFIFEDGSIFRVSIGKNKKSSDLSIFYDNGVWIGDENDFSFRVGSDLFKAYIDEYGFLYVVKDETTVKFFRVCDPEASL